MLVFSPLLYLHEHSYALGTEDVAAACLVGVKNGATAAWAHVALIKSGHESECVIGQEGLQLPRSHGIRALFGELEARAFVLLSCHVRPGRSSYRHETEWTQKDMGRYCSSFIPDSYPTRHTKDHSTLFSITIPSF